MCLKGFLAPPLLLQVQLQLERGDWYERDHGAIASELCLRTDATVGLLHFLVNDPLVFTTVGAITGVTGLSCFGGRVYRRLPGSHHDSWHADTMAGREVGMSLNLGTTAFEGGAFEIRDENTQVLRGAIANTGQGDAILFSIAEGLEHRMAPLGGSHHKTAFAGWFGRDRNYLAALHRDPYLRDE